MDYSSLYPRSPGDTSALLSEDDKKFLASIPYQEDKTFDPMKIARKIMLNTAFTLDMHSILKTIDEYVEQDAESASDECFMKFI